MKKIYIAVIFLLIAIWTLAEIMEENGKPGKTGSPGENDCTGCHTSFTVNSGPGSITISSPDLINWEYTLGDTFQIDVTVAQTGVPLFGFGFEALRTSNNTNGGTLKITDPLSTSLKNANVNGSNRTNVVHTLDGGLTNTSHTFSFNWVAPTTNIGNVRFYAAGNATDNQGDSLGDYIYKTTQLVTPFTTGLSKASANGIIQVFPNPAHDILNLKLPANIYAGIFQLFNLDGSLVLSESKQHIITPSVIIQLPGDLSNGVYFLKVSANDNKNFTAKVFVYN